MAMPRDLYICHTPYQLLIAFVRALRAGGGQAVWLCDTIPAAETLSAKLGAAFDETAILHEDRWPGLVTGPLGHWRNRRAYEQRGVGPKLDRKRYRDIYICNDWSVVGRYLQDCNAGYILCEDTVGGTLDPDQHLLDAQRAAPAGPYAYWGDSPACAKIESEDAARCTIFPPERLATFSKKALLESLTEAEKTAVRNVFLTKPLPNDAAALAEATLLLPRDFVADGLLNEADQRVMFRAVAAQYPGPLYLKTHPRDATDYAVLFPDAVILDRTMPSEVLNFCLPGKFARAVTVQSWVLRGFTGAEQTIFWSLDDAKALAGLS